MKKLFLFATFLCAMCLGRVFGQEDPDIVWQKNLFPEKRITDVKYHPDGERIFVATEDKTLVLNAENGEIIHELPIIFGDGKYRIDISADGKDLITVDLKLSGGVSRLIKWDANTYRALDSTEFDGNLLVPEDLAFFANDQFIVVASNYYYNPSNITLIILDAETLDVVKYYDEENTAFQEVAASPDGKYFATISKEMYHSGSVRKLTLWDAATFEKVKELKNTSERLIKPIEFAPNGEDLFYTMGKTIVKYSILQEEQISHDINSTFSNFDIGPKNKICFSGQIASVAYTATLDFLNNEIIHHYEELFEEVARGIELSPDNSLIAHGGYRIVSLLRAKWEPTGLKEIASKNLTLFPNPTTGSVIIGVTVSKIKAISLSNESATLNEKIDNYQILSDSEISLDLSEYPDGVYFIRVESASGLETFKAIKGGVQ